MFSRLIVPFLVALAGAPAFAQLPEPLERALSVTSQSSDTESVLLRLGRGEEMLRIRMVFADGDVSYELVEPATVEALNEAQAEIWDGYANRGEDDDEASEPEPEATEEDDEESSSVAIGDYNPDALRASIGEDVTLINEAGSLLTYGFTPNTLPVDGDVPDAFVENLRGEIDVDTERGQVAAVRFAATESFKPNMAARIHVFSIEQTYVHEPALGGPRMRSLSMNIEGSAMFQSFEQAMLMVVEEVQYRAAPVTEG